MAWEHTAGRQDSGGTPDSVWWQDGGAAYLSRKVEVSMMMLLERVKLSAVRRTRTGR